MKNILLVFFLLLSAFTQGQVVYSGPITITKGGTYTGNYKSDDSNIPAITLQTYEPVEITHCNIVSSGIHIKCPGGTNLNIHHNNFSGQKPTGNNQWGRVLDDYHPQYLIFENNLVNHTGGLLIDHSDESTRSAIIRYNIFRNTDKRRVDMSEGEHRASILFNTVLPVTGEIAYNKFENLLDSSWIEDNINLGNSGGTAASPFLIHDNYIKGAYPYPFNADHYTGSGITVEGSPSMNQFNNVSQYIKIYNNQVISTCNGGININAGHNIDVAYNTIVSSGMFPNGVQSQRFWGGGAVWNGSNVGTDVFKDITYKNNTIGYVRPGVNVPYANRQDWVTVDGSPYNIQPGDNISLPNPINLATELAEIPKWEAKLAANKITLGNTASTTTVNDPVASIAALTIKLGQKATGIIYPLNVKGDTVTYKAGSMKAVSADNSIFTITTSGNNLTITPLKAGAGKGTITLISNAGKTISKNFTIEVLSATPAVVEPVDFNIGFIITQ